MSQSSDFAPHIRANVAAALSEDIQHGDLTAQLIPEHMPGHATVITRQDAVLCGTEWFDTCFKTLDEHCVIEWFAHDGDAISARQTLCEIRGNARAMLTAERAALNFLQTLSATATQTRCYVDAVRGTAAKIMDTRKTLPGLRIAQKYAVTMGGGFNQRMGLFDGVLIKENHIMAAEGSLHSSGEPTGVPFTGAAGGIRHVLRQTCQFVHADISIQIEVENINELQEALDAGAKLILLDNFNLAELREAVQLTAGRAELEASGGVTLNNVRAIAETGVNRISIGGLTKDIQAIDLSLRFNIHY
ncbi:MAG: nicotinate-nucleotide diphosphorylase [Candidatus Nitrotoga sp.]